MSPEAREKHRKACANPDKEPVVYEPMWTPELMFERRCNATRNWVHKKFHLTSDFERVRSYYANYDPEKEKSAERCLIDDGNVPF
jgi:hypothetical protein